MPKKQPKRAAARDFQNLGHACKTGRRRAQQQQTNNNGQYAQAQLAPQQPHAVQQPQAAPQYQAVLSQ